MQKLSFEPAWDRTLAQKDRMDIQRIFSEVNHEHREGQSAVIIKTAFNHKEEFLVTVLLNNYSTEPFSLLSKEVFYKEDERVVGEFISAYALEVPAQTSMPWTFIFRKESLIVTPAEERGELTIR